MLTPCIYVFGRVFSVVACNEVEFAVFMLFCPPNVLSRKVTWSSIKHNFQVTFHSAMPVHLFVQEDTVIKVQIHPHNGRLFEFFIARVFPFFQMANVSTFRRICRLHTSTIIITLPHFLFLWMRLLLLSRSIFSISRRRRLFSREYRVLSFVMNHDFFSPASIVHPAGFPMIYVPNYQFSWDYSPGLRVKAINLFSSTMVPFYEWIQRKHTFFVPIVHVILRI